MRRIWWLLGLILWASRPSASVAWEIASFEVNITIHEDATAAITETIGADFTGEHRHGLYRDIPIHYTDRAGQHFVIRLRVRDVVNEQDVPWPYRLESHERYVRVRIGEADTTVTGRQTYRIRYDVARGAVRFFPNHDECYWNLTGNEWAVPIQQASARIELPETVSDVRALAYVGVYGSTERLEPSPSPHERIVILEPSRALRPYEGVTAVIGWAKGSVHPPSTLRVIGWWLSDNWVYGIPLVVFVGMLWLWNAKGRDPHLHRSPVVQYEPPDDLCPAEAGTLWDQRVDVRDVTSSIVDLAVRGYLRIEPIETGHVKIPRVADYHLVNLKSWIGDATLKPFEQELLKGLFKTPLTTVELSDLEQQFYSAFLDIRDDIYRGLVARGYFDSHPDTVRAHYMAWSVGVGFSFCWGLTMTAGWHQGSVAAAWIASAMSTAIIFLFGFVMPRRTLNGAQVMDRLAGFIEFLRRADADRIRRINDPSLFERGLPYAMAFGLVDRWAKAFEGLAMAAPAWYGGQWDTFSVRGFGRELNHTMSSMGQSLTATPRSSSSWGGSGFGGGGGFSGGGGGGGGGGAW